MRVCGGCTYNVEGGYKSGERIQESRNQEKKHRVDGGRPMSMNDGVGDRDHCVQGTRRKKAEERKKWAAGGVDFYIENEIAQRNGIRFFAFHTSDQNIL